MQTYRETDLNYLTKRYDTIIETLEWILTMLKHPNTYDNDRIILEVEDFLKKLR